MVDDSGKVMQYLNYHPFGDMQNHWTSYSEPMRFTGKERDHYGAFNYYYFGARYYDPWLGQFSTTDPMADKYPNLGIYSYAMNNPIMYIDPDGTYVETIIDVISVGLSAADMYNDPSWKNAGWLTLDIVCAVVPLLPAAGTVRHAGEISKILNRADDAADAAKAVDKGADAAKTADKATTFQTYKKTHPETGDVYSGRTSGTADPRKNVAKRDRYHQKNKEGYDPAELDKSSSNPDAIRAREQQLIDKYGGAQSEGGTSGNRNRGVAKANPNANKYKKAAERAFPED